MKNIRKLVFFCLLILLLVSVASATGEISNTTGNIEDVNQDTDNTQITSQNNHVNKADENIIESKESSNNEKKETSYKNIEKKSAKDVNLKEADTWTDLQNEIQMYSIYIFTKEVTIKLTNNCTATGNITWNNPKVKLTIDGKGHTIDANHKLLFKVDEDCTLILKNITIKNAESKYGAIYNRGTLKITDSTLENNKVLQGTYGPGAIYNSKGILSITNSTLQNNQGAYGGAIENLEGTVTIKDSILQNNFADDGGAIYNANEGNLTITNSTLQNNQGNKGGAIENLASTMTIKNSTLQNNYAPLGGAIYNTAGGNLIITNSTLQNNKAITGGAIYNLARSKTIVTYSDFIGNNASSYGAIHSYDGFINLTCNNFIKNGPYYNSGETIDLEYTENIVKDNNYKLTSISFDKVELTVKDNKKTFIYGDNISLNFNLVLKNPRNYDEDVLDRIDKILYLNNEEITTTSKRNYTLSGLDIGKYTLYYSTGFKQSNSVTFTVKGAEIKTNQTSDYSYDDENNVILDITDPSGEKGTVDLFVKDGDEYNLLLRYYNVKDEYIISTQTIKDALENIYDVLDDSYIIRATYNSNYDLPSSSTEFTLNINKQRNTKITYDILNNTEGNVKINITVTDASNTPINDARIEITGNITQNTTAGIITDNTLSHGEYTINVKYNQTEDYKSSEATIDFTVEIDKDKKIAELEEQVENLTGKLDDSQQTIDELNNNITGLNNQLELKDNKIENLTQQLTSLTRQFSEAQEKINNLTQQNNKLNSQLRQANNKIGNLTAKLDEALKTIENLNNNITGLNNQLELKDNKIENLTRQLTNLTRQFSEAQEKINNLTQQNNKLNSQLRQANNKIENLTGKLDDAQKTIDSLNNKITNLTQEIKQKENMIDNLTKQLTDAQNEIETLTKEKNKLNSQLSQAKNNIKNLTAKLEESQKTINDLNNKITNLTQEIKQKENMIDNLTKQLTGAQNEIETLTKENNKLNSQLSQAKNNIKNLTTKLEESQKTIDDLNSNITRLTEEIKQKENKIENLTKQLTGAQNEIETLTQEKNILNSQLQQANKEIKSLKLQLETANNKIGNLTKTINNLTAQLAQSQKEIQSLINKIKHLTNPLNTSITINPIKSSVGLTATLSANITDENGEKISEGKAVFKINGITLKDDNNNVLYARVNNGLASINYKVPDVWMKNTSYVEVVYGGTDSYNEARTRATDVLDISKGNAVITLDEESITAKSGETIKLRAKIVDSNGDRINTGKVVFKLNGKTLKDSDGEVLYAGVSDGEAVLDYTIPSIYSAKKYTLTAVYGGSCYERAETMGTLTLEKKAVTISKDSISTINGKTSIKAKITDETGKLLVTSTKLVIKINQKTILGNVTSNNGLIDVSFTTTLRPGLYELLIISGENSIYKKGTLTTVLEI